jgi:hypothetical protein
MNINNLDSTTPTWSYKEAQSTVPICPLYLYLLYLRIIITLCTSDCIPDAVLDATVMTPSSRFFRRIRRDRLSISVVPEQSRDAEPQTPYLHWLFGESSDADFHSRLINDNPDGTDDGTGYSKADAVIMKEVAAWLELRERDEFWATKDKHASKV